MQNISQADLILPDRPFKMKRGDHSPSVLREQNSKYSAEDFCHWFVDRAIKWTPFSNWWHYYIIFFHVSQQRAVLLWL
jgi:hypothetical protein